MSQPIPLRLTLQIQLTDLKVQLQNPNDYPVRVWALGNSWGGSSWSVSLTAGDAASRVFTLHPTRHPYTANIARFIEVPAHGEREIRLAPHGLEWVSAESLSGLEAVPIHVRVALEIAPSFESREQKVATGRAETAEVVSQPPHIWLFGAAAP